MIRRIVPFFVFAAVSISATGCASTGFYGYPRTARNVDDRAYTRGYDEGRDRGENDARRNRSFDYSRHGSYRDADNGYRGYGDRNGYRALFRRGFENGYTDGYRRYARGGYGGPARGYPGGYPAPNPVPVYRDRGFSPAAQVGYRDGYEQGRSDARDRDRYDPVRASRYRSGDHEYNSRYGSREDYKREYRAAFQLGYDQGYRESRR
jgi:hypothetical protein